jgi:hypothetical protein
MKRSFETQNVILWLSNDFDLYKSMTRIVERNKQTDYIELIEELNLTTAETPDGVAWLHDSVDFEDLNSFVTEIGGAS